MIIKNKIAYALVAVIYLVLVLVIGSILFYTIICYATPAVCAQVYRGNFDFLIALLVGGEVAIFVFFVSLSRAKDTKQVENISTLLWKTIEAILTVS